MRQVDLIVIHCTATHEGVDYSVDQIREWHVRDRGFRDIGYHFFIHLDGKIEKGRSIDTPGAHAKGYNTHSIGIVYVGGLSKEGKPKDTRTVAQLHALRRCVETLKIAFGIEEVVGHRDLSVDLNGDGMISANEWMKSCPCFDVKTEL